MISIYKKNYIRFKTRLSAIFLRINKFIILNKLRMFIYKKILGLNIGENSIIWCGNIFNDITDTKIGKNVIIGPNNVFLIRGGIDIGNNVNLSGFSFFISQSHNYNDPYGHTTIAKIVIKDNAWVATASTILPGVIIGEGAVVAAGSVVVRNVPNYAVVAGNPAKIVGKRNKEIKYVLNDSTGIKWL